MPHNEFAHGHGASTKQPLQDIRIHCLHDLVDVCFWELLHEAVLQGVIVELTLTTLLDTLEKGLCCASFVLPEIMKVLT